MDFQVTIRTRNGKWNKKTTFEDPLFSDILAPFIELKERPTEVILDGIVAEAFETQWSSYEALISLMDDLDAYYHEPGDAHFEPSRMARLISGGRYGSYAGYSSYGPTVYIHQINVLSRILTMPENWELCVAVDETKSSDQEVDQHIELMGRAVLRDSSSSYVNVDDDHIIAATIWRTYSLMHDVKDVLPYFYGYLRNAALIDIGRSPTPKSLSWTSMPWNSFRRVLGKDNSNNDGSRIIRQTASMWLGEGSYKNQVVLDVLPRFDAKYRKIDMKDMIDVPKLYDVMFESFPEDVDPILIGLGPIIGCAGLDYYPRSANAQSAMMVALINHYTLMYPQWLATSAFSGQSIEGSYIDEEYYSIAIELMISTTIGRPGLYRILLSLMSWYEREENNAKYYSKQRSRVITFAQSIESRLLQGDDNDEKRATLGERNNERIAKIDRRIFDMIRDRNSKYRYNHQ